MSETTIQLAVDQRAGAHLSATAFDRSKKN